MPTNRWKPCSHDDSSWCVESCRPPWKPCSHDDSSQCVESCLNHIKIKDSGKRQKFSSGMVRDTQEGKIDYTSVLDGPMLDRWAAHLTTAKEKYPDVKPGVANWTLAAGEEELVRFKKSAFRHFRQWIRGEQDEDHAAAVFFNINGLEFVKEKLKNRLK